MRNRRPRPQQPGPWCSFGIWGTGTYTPGEATAGERVHQDHDLIWIIEGTPTWFIDGVEYQAKAPCIILARPGMRDRIRWDRQRRSRNCYLHFTPRYALAQVPDERTWPLLTSLPADDVVRPLLRQVVLLLSTRPAGWEALAASAMAHAIGMLCSGVLQAAELAPMQVGPLSRQVAELLARRWGLAAQRAGAVLQAPTLGELAVAARRTREGFCRAFRNEVGFAPLQALRLIRLERAASLLAEGRLGVAEVASRCGFPDAFNFSRLFAASYRCPPRDFRAAFQAGKVHARLGGPEAFDRFRLCLVDALQWGR